jgi:predicted NAD/FAD-binding protein
VKNYPAEVLAEWFCLPSWRRNGLKRVQSGIEEIVQNLVSDISDVRCNTIIKSVEMLKDPITQKKQVLVTYPDGSQEYFDHVVLATQANHALSLIKNPLPEHVTGWS